MHHTLKVNGTIGVLEAPVLHFPFTSLEQFVAKQNRYSSLAARQLHERGAQAGALRMLLSPLVRFVKFYVLRLGFLDGLPGLIHIAIGGMNSFTKYAKLIEMNRRKQ